jgi:ubiquinone/menaquinone biosynthesis C-methylase UbiE
MEDPNTYYKTRMKKDKEREKVWKEITNYLQRYIPKDAKTLELGAGYCDFINNIKAKEKHALDIYDGIKEHAKNEVTTHIMSATEIKAFKAESFNCIFASNFFEHLEREDFHKVLEGCFKALRKGGRLIILQPNYYYAYREYFDDYTHKMVLSHISFCDAMESKGFKIKKCYKRFLPYSMKSGAPKARILIWAYLRSPIKPLAKQMLIVAEK